MESKTLELEREALKRIRWRWKPRAGFTPLERLDGVNQTTESIEALRDSPLCWEAIDRRARNMSTERLLDDLDELYARAAQPWELFRTVFESKYAQRELMRWPYGTFPRRIREEAKSRFWELKTTTRFSVHEIPNLPALQRVNWPVPPITERHLAGLAAMVCIVMAIEALEDVLFNWNAESRIYREGKPFNWLAVNDNERLDMILSVILESANEMSFYTEKIRDAWEERNQAEAWLSHVDTLDLHEAELERSIRQARAKTIAEVKEKKTLLARGAASMPRGEGKGITAQMVANFFNARRGQKITALIAELATSNGVSESTVQRRYRDAKSKKLLS